MRKSKILLVDDDEVVRRGLTRRLQASGYDVVGAADGYAAVSVASAERPVLIVLDMGLPGGGGLAVLRCYANLEALRTIPVIILTGAAGDTLELALRQFGVIGLLTKPADFQELLGLLEHALSGEAVLAIAGECSPSF